MEGCHFWRHVNMCIIEFHWSFQTCSSQGFNMHHFDAAYIALVPFLADCSSPGEGPGFVSFAMRYCRCWTTAEAQCYISTSNVYDVWCIGHVGVNCVKFKDATHQRILYHVQVQGRPSNDVVSHLKKCCFCFQPDQEVLDSHGLASYNAGMVNYLPVLQRVTRANLLEG